MASEKETIGVSAVSPTLSPHKIFVYSDLEHAHNRYYIDGPLGERMLSNIHSTLLLHQRDVVPSGYLTCLYFEENGNKQNVDEMLLRTVVVLTLIVHKHKTDNKEIPIPVHEWLSYLC